MARLSSKHPRSSRVPAPLPTVYVVDDDVSVREALEGLIQFAGWQPLLFASAQEFLDHPMADTVGCMVLDINLPGLNGLDLQQQLASVREAVPIIFITGYGDIPSTVQAMKAGAVEFLTKPFDDDTLLAAIASALERSRAVRDIENDLRMLRDVYARLTSREREIMAMVVQGRLNKVIAGELGISEITVKAHRGRVMRKMSARSLADLISMARRLQSAPLPEV